LFLQISQGSFINDVHGTRSVIQLRIPSFYQQIQDVILQQIYVTTNNSQSEFTTYHLKFLHILQFHLRKKVANTKNVHLAMHKSHKLYLLYSFNQQFDEFLLFLIASDSFFCYLIAFPARMSSYITKNFPLCFLITCHVYRSCSSLKLCEIIILKEARNMKQTLIKFSTFDIELIRNF